MAPWWPAISRAARRKQDLDYCLVDVGYRGVRMYIYRGSEFRNRRTVDLGLYDLEREISESRGVDIHVAHTHLMTDYQQAQTLDASQELYNRMAIEIDEVRQLL